VQLALAPWADGGRRREGLTSRRSVSVSDSEMPIGATSTPGALKAAMRNSGGRRVSSLTGADDMLWAVADGEATRTLAYAMPVGGSCRE